MHDEDLKKLRELKNKIISSKENEMMGKLIAINLNQAIQMKFIIVKVQEMNT